MAIRVFGKINLFLRILAKRPDGYHEIETLMHPLNLYDDLHASHGHNGFTLECADATSPQGPENTVHRAYHLLKERFAPRVGSCRIQLRKGIPTQAGMGGASADAAGALLALNRLFDLNLDRAQLMELGSQIGSDVAFFLGEGPAVGCGRGERLSPAEGYLEAPVALAISQQGVSTGEAYARFKPDPRERMLSIEPIQQALKAQDAQETSRHLYNTFERLIYPIRPDLQRIRLAFLAAGASGAMMTGSGATIFALGVTPANIQRAREVLDPMERKTVFTTLQRNTHEWLNKRGADPRSDPS